MPNLKSNIEIIRKEQKNNIIKTYAIDAICHFVLGDISKENICFNTYKNKIIDSLQLDELLYIESSRFIFNNKNEIKKEMEINEFRYKFLIPLMKIIKLIYNKRHLEF